MERAYYIRFHEAIMSPGRGGNNIGKAHLVERDENGKRVASTSPRDELMDEILVGDVWVILRNEKGSRRTHASNVKDWEPAPPAQKETKTK